MKVIYTNKETVTFGSLNVGDVFKSGSFLYMKIDCVYDQANEYRNVACLETGKTEYFEAWHSVFKVDCELVVK